MSGIVKRTDGSSDQKESVIVANTSYVHWREASWGDQNVVTNHLWTHAGYDMTDEEPSEILRSFGLRCRQCMTDLD